MGDQVILISIVEELVVRFNESWARHAARGPRLNGRAGLFMVS